MSDMELFESPNTSCTHSSSDYFMAQHIDSEFCSTMSTVTEIKGDMVRLANLIESDETLSTPNPTACELHAYQTKLPNYSALTESVKTCIADAIELIMNSRRQTDSTLQDVEAAIMETELISRQQLEAERDMWLKCNEKLADSPARPLNSLLDQTAVFELLERNMVASVDEIEKIKVQCKAELEETKRHAEDIELQLLGVKGEKNRLEHELNRSEAESVRLTLEISRIKQAYEGESEELRTICSRLEDDAKRCGQKLQHSEARVVDLERELKAVHAIVREIVEHHIPAHLFPLTRDPLPRLAEAWNAILKRCPWIFSAIADENHSPSSALPNPVSLMIKQKLLIENLTLERNNAQDKLHRATEELTAMQKVRDELEKSLEAATLQAQIDKSEIGKLKQNITRYRGYIRQFLSLNLTAPVHSEPVTPCPTDSQSSVTSIATSASMDSKYRFLMVIHYDQQFLLISHGVLMVLFMNSSATVQSVASTSPLTSPSPLLSRMGAVVSAIVTAISPHRGVPSPQEPLPTISRHPTDHRQQPQQAVHSLGLPRHSDQSPKSSVPVFLAIDHSQILLSPLVGFANFNWLFIKPSLPDTNLTEGTWNPSNVKTSTNPFAIPPLPRSSNHPLGKRRPLGELPFTVSEDGNSGDSRQPAIPVSEPTETAEHVTSTAITGSKQPKLFDFEGDSLLPTNPLAESTAGPFRRPPLPSAADAKRTRVDQVTPVARHVKKPIPVEIKPVVSRSDWSRPRSQPLLSVPSPVIQKITQPEPTECRPS
ncbi:uncharacterized protein DEA37_0006122 [Paragonimus westermani]|uniref:Uncharacterized protein n=1 Tax=Paragonimus westermani TaxID=34504 RepID=A0A5J4NB03_9TREM|nr:uncharacterized protein DEA37_0006122 [Paragonimus westermani]